jgi:hypothetical protein
MTCGGGGGRQGGGVGEEIRGVSEYRVSGEYAGSESIDSLKDL